MIIFSFSYTYVDACADILMVSFHLCRGNLNLTLLPTSDLRLSFAGDDGQMELIVTLSNSDGFLCGTIEEISEDTSGRSFVIKISDGRAFFFWCSEKSKLLGGELLGKVRDFLFNHLVPKST